MPVLTGKELRVLTLLKKKLVWVKALMKKLSPNEGREVCCQGSTGCNVGDRAEVDNIASHHLALSLDFDGEADGFKRRRLIRDYVAPENVYLGSIRDSCEAGPWDVHGH